MIAKKSDLILKRFVVVDSQFKFNVPAESIITNPIDVINSYPVDIDFSIEQDASKTMYRIVTTVNINEKTEENNPGYSIGVTGIGFFEFDIETKLTEDQKINMLQNSALSICITNLRSYISNQTSYFPWGIFSFHAVDIQDLLLSKEKLTQQDS